MAGPYYVDDGGGKAVTAATKANPCSVTIVGHGFATNDKVVFHNVGGMTELNFTNGSTGYTVTKVNDDTITIGVDSSAFGTYTSGGTAHNGLSWAAAFTSLSALDDVFTFASGEFIYIGHDHVCQYTHSGHRTISMPSSGKPCVIISVTQGSNPPTYQASTSNQIDSSEGAHQIVFDGCVAMYGVCINSGYHVFLSSDLNETAYLYGCTIKPGSGSIFYLSNTSGRSVIDSCTLNCVNDSGSQSAAVVGATGAGCVEVINSTFVSVSNRTGIVCANSCSTNFSGCDLRGFTNATTCEIYGGTNTAGTVVNFSNCITASTWSPFTRGSVAECTFTNCGPADAPTYIFKGNYYGDLTSGTSVYRTGGASVAGTACSWKVVTTADCAEGTTFDTPWINGYLDSPGSKAFDVYITNDTALFNNSQVWLELELLASDGSPQATLYSTRRTITATATSHPTDSTSIWKGLNDAAQGLADYRQRLTLTATVDRAGQFRARVCVGEASIAAGRYFYIDPEVVVTG